MKKLKRNSVLFLMCLSIFSTLLLSGTVFAQNINLNHINVNDVISNFNNEKEIVVKINEDGSFVTIPLNESNLYANCSHFNSTTYGPITTTKESYNKNNSTYCYRLKESQRIKCLDCGQFISTLNTWTDYKHSYGFLSNKCKECGYEK